MRTPRDLNSNFCAHDSEGDRFGGFRARRPALTGWLYFTLIVLALGVVGHIETLPVQ